MEAIEIFKWIGVIILVVVGIWIFSRLFWKSAFKGFFEELEQYNKSKRK
jgi:uncharacterized membrane protein